MATIKEDYCQKEIYRLLIEKGFDGEIHTTYDDEGYTQASVSLQMAMKWLREIHHIHIVIKSVIRLYEDTEYYYELYGTKNKSLCISCDIYKGESWDSNEQACEEAIKYCLENLI